MITTPEQLAALRAMTHEQLVGEVVASRLRQANAEMLLRHELDRRTVQTEALTHSSKLLARLMGIDGKGVAA